MFRKRLAASDQANDEIVTLCALPWRHALELSELLRLEGIESRTAEDSHFDILDTAKPVFVFRRDLERSQAVLSDFQTHLEGSS